MNELDIIFEDLDIDQKAIGERIKAYGNNLDADEKLIESRMRFISWCNQVENKE